MTPHLLLWLTAGGLVLLTVAARARGGQFRRGFVAVNPRYRAALRRHGLTRFEDFADRSGLIISGHADREVARVTLGDDLQLFVKREHRVGWAVRWANARSGYGFVSRSLREARTLDAVRREGIGCPEWVAAGEDGRGRAFLVLRALEAVDLATFLRDRPEPGRRRRLALALGEALARLHRTGLDHPDLYAKHVLVDPRDDSLHFLDWQRSCRRRAVGGRLRVSDLGALHATLPVAAASPRERLAFLCSYLRSGPVPSGPTPRLKEGVRQVAVEARRLLLRRHVREKLRSAQRNGAAQDWTCLQGEALCVTSALEPGWAAAWPAVLALDRAPTPPGLVARRWLTLPGTTSALLVRRRSRRPLAALWCWLRRRPMVSPEQRQAALLFRLQRNCVPTPRVLAMGNRRGPFGLQESFLLTEPAAGSTRLGAWLTLTGRGTGSVRNRVLREAGTLLARLHEAGCYLRGTCPLVVRADTTEPTLVLGGVEAVASPRGARRGWALEDLNSVQDVLKATGCDATEMEHFLASYAAVETTVASPPPEPARPAVPSSRGRTVGPPFAGYQYPPRDGLWTRLVRGATRVRQRGDWAAFAGAGWERRVMDVAFTHRFHTKQGRSVGRWVLHAPGEQTRRLTVYLKRHHRLPWWQGVLAALCPGRGWSPATRESARLEWARRQGLPVPEVVAIGEHIGPWFRLRSFLAVEELAGMAAVDEAIPLAVARLRPEVFRAWKQGLLEEMARLTRLLHDRHCFHKDLYLCHFFIPRSAAGGVPVGGWRGRVYLIDLHRMARHPLAWRLWRVKDLAQLLYSSEVTGVTARDRLAFWRAYRDAASPRCGERLLWRWVIFKWGRYRRHNDRAAARAAVGKLGAGR